jgi:hypothetical protein
VNRGRTNNAGFVSDQDQDRNDPRPLLAVIGDSYVEAMMVPHRHTVQERVQRCIGTQGRVYGFAASGAPLSQYLIWADYARLHYAPRAMVFVMVGNDFDESLSKYKTGPGFHHFAEAGNGELSLQLYDYSPVSLRKIARRSALLRHLFFSLHIETTLAAPWSGLLPPAEADGTPQHVGNTASDSTDVRLQDSQRAVIAFFEELPRRAAILPSTCSPVHAQTPSGWEQVRVR